MLSVRELGETMKNENLEQESMFHENISSIYSPSTDTMDPLSPKAVMWLVIKLIVNPI